GRRLHQASQLAYAAAQLCDASAGGGGRRGDHPAAAGTPGPADDGTLPAPDSAVVGTGRGTAGAVAGPASGAWGSGGGGRGPAAGRAPAGNAALLSRRGKEAALSEALLLTAPLGPASVGRPPLEVADLVRACGPAFLARYGSALSTAQRRALADVAVCRTAALGGHVQRCGACGHEAPAYNSCRNRHCPKCQGSRTAAWLQREASFLLPVPYYHVVFTLPAAVAEVVWQNQRLGYTLLFQAVQ